ncbi:ATP-binding cassette domain-containing protein [Novosphingobium cyanobacteriorum]|uniref:ATP-binding cassette domain-containing protein n=1 Tax=Novosphingobium cyanobacteriorum TaxID=3024215 RepID=A0ABT6CMN1_9SPHN|nr:ATP-binding cassette domain-containing protein [Novosphingobium cyanobacteriorum]MDF8335167.1 ATP-binding cassette domain-containing protein [Novosphingobium cyanobacteriorum]
MRDYVEMHPMPMIDALVALGAMRGIATCGEALSAALPVSQGQLAERFVPLALSRIGLEAHWHEIANADLQISDLPVLAPTVDGRALLIVGAGDDDLVLVRDAAGERAIHLLDLLPALSGKMLRTGHVDPVNGAGESQERDLVRRNPRLWLLGAYLAERKVLVRLVAAAALLNLCAMAIPLYMRAIYDRVVPNLAISSLWALSAGIVIVLVFELLLKKLKSSFVDGLAVRVGQAVQHRAVTAILRARSRSQGQGVGSVMTALRDLEQLALLIPQAIVTFCVDLPFVVLFFALIAAIGGMVVLGPLVGAAGLLGFGMVANYALKVASRRSSKLVQARSDLIAELNEGWTTIKANRSEGLFEGRWDVLSDHLALGNKHVRHWSELPASVSGLIVQFVTVMVVVIGVLQIRAGIMTSGALIAVVLLTGRAMVPVAGTVAMFARLYQSLAQFEALAAILKEEAERQVSDPAIGDAPIKGAIAASRLGHRFADAAAPSLVDVSFTIRPGEKIALIGKSGSGKSTLLQLIAGLVQPQEGLLTIDGHAIDRFAIPHLRRSVVYSAQDATIFDGTLWHNILLGLPEPDERTVDRAIRCSGLDSFVARTAEGYMRKAGPRGQALSGGQRQALLLARALVRDPAVLLLDEPTASLDVASEQSVIAGLREACADKTLVVATHRLAVLDLVDRVIWLEEGRIIADRPKAEVLARLGAQAAQRHAAAAA